MTIDLWLFLAAPMVLSVLMVGMHAYLGLHVLERDVIFVDISLSQVAALGAALSLLASPEGSEASSLAFSLGLCVFVSLILSYFRHYEKHLSQEALIGMTYALASGALVLVLDQLPHGAEHLKSALVGNILFVTWSEVLNTAVVYAIIGGIHFIYRKKFWAASSKRVHSFFWDFLFYTLFGIVITLSTKHAGVLVVFAILVAPAAMASLWALGVQRRLLFAWGCGGVGVFGAFLVSTHWDLPAGPSLVVVLTLLFFMSFVLKLATSKLRS